MIVKVNVPDPVWVQLLKRAEQEGTTVGVVLGRGAVLALATDPRHARIAAQLADERAYDAETERLRGLIRARGGVV